MTVIIQGGDQFPDTVEGLGDLLDEVDARLAAHMATAPPWPAHYVGEPDFNRLWDTRELKREHEMHCFMYRGVSRHQWMTEQRALEKRRGLRFSNAGVFVEYDAWERAVAHRDFLRANPEFCTARELIDAVMDEEAANTRWRFMYDRHKADKAKEEAKRKTDIGKPMKRKARRTVLVDGQRVAVEMDR
jgi:hypothetical protein